MAWDLWFAFLAAAAIVLAIPGPTVMLVLSYAAALGRRAALAVVAGVMLGDLAAMTLSFAGLGTLLATSAALFDLLRLAGAAYLIWLGLKLWRTPATGLAPGPVAPAASAWRIFGHAFAVTALNPKSIAFFVAFVPQFMDPQAPLLPQIAILETSFVLLAGINALLYAVAGTALHRPGLGRLIGRLGGSALIAAGAATALWRR